MSKELSSKNSQQICGLCDKNASKYCCPRCEVFYCSLDCYKSQNHTTCSESFYRDWVNEELASHHADDESRRKMVDILKRMRNEEGSNPGQLEDLLENEENTDESDVDSDDEEALELHERMKQINLDDADGVWNALTEDEKNEFEALVNQGDVGSIMQQWQPWWIYNKEERLVQDVSNEDNTEEEALKKCPKLKDVPKLNLLTTVQPSPAIKFNIVNVIASHVFILRYFNGELDPIEGAIYLLNICANLDTNTNFEDIETAVEVVKQKCLQSNLIQTDEYSLEVMKYDTFLTLQGPSKENKSYYCKATLSYLQKLLSEAKSAPKIHKTDVRNDTMFYRKFPEYKMDHLPQLDLCKVKKCIKKLEYYSSYVESYGMEFK